MKCRIQVVHLMLRFSLFFCGLQDLFVTDLQSSGPWENATYGPEAKTELARHKEIRFHYAARKAEERRNGRLEELKNGRNLWTQIHDININQ